MITMSRFHLAALAWLILSAKPAVSAEPAFSLKLSAPESSVKSGSEIFVKVLLTNGTDRALELGWGVPPENCCYFVDMRDESGQPLPKTRLERLLHPDDHEGRDAKEPPLPPGSVSILVGNGGTASLQAHGAREDQLHLNRLFDLTEPGKYTIHVERKDYETNTIVKSNEIVITIVQADSAKAGDTLK